MEKNFIDEFIPSKDTRDYLHSIHHEFTDLEKASNSNWNCCCWIYYSSLDIEWI